MPVRKAEAVWKGSLQEGGGTVKLPSGLFEGPYTFKARVEDAEGTNPEELLGAAHAACYAMFLSAQLGRAGHTVNEVRAVSEVTLVRDESGLRVSGIHLVVEASIPGIDDAAFQELAEKSKTGCPISGALASVPITLNAKLV